MTNKKFLLSVLACALFGLPAWASVASYCDSASPSCTYDAAAFDSSGLLAIDFTSASIVTNSFTDPTSGTAFNDYAGGIMTNPSDTLTDTKGGYQIILPANTMLFALNLSAGPSYNISFYAGATYTAFTLSAGSTFFGVTSDASITSLNILSNGNVADTLSNFELQGQGQPPTGGDTPEVGTLLLIGTGLIVMRWMKRWPRRLFRSSPQPA